MSRNKRTRRRKAKARVANVPLQAAFPPHKIVALNYSDIYTLGESGAGGGAYQLMRTADVFDPDTSGSGHQPLYFDQLCTSAGPYLAHTTMTATFQIRFVNTSSVPIFAVVFPANYTATPGSRSIAAEKPFAWKHVIPPTGTGGASVATVYKMNNAKFVGLSPQAFEAVYFGSHSGSSTSPYLQVGIIGLGGSAASAQVEITAVYNTKFFQLGNETQS
jgi:hypothetical protein